MARQLVTIVRADGAAGRKLASMVKRWRKADLESLRVALCTDVERQKGWNGFAHFYDSWSMGDVFEMGFLRDRVHRVLPGGEVWFGRTSETWREHLKGLRRRRHQFAETSYLIQTLSYLVGDSDWTGEPAGVALFRSSFDASLSDEMELALVDAAVCGLTAGALAKGMASGEPRGGQAYE